MTHAQDQLSTLVLHPDFLNLTHIEADDFLVRVTTENRGAYQFRGTLAEVVAQATEHLARYSTV